MSLTDYTCVPLRVAGRCEWCNGMAALGHDLCAPCGESFSEDKRKLGELIQSDAEAKEFWAHFKAVAY